MASRIAESQEKIWPSTIFKDYLCVTDIYFVRYLRNKKNSHDDGEYFTVEQLLTMSLIEFHILKDSGKWNYLSPEQEQIMALTSEMTHLKDHNLKLANNAGTTKRNNSGGNPSNLIRERSPAINLQMNRNGLGRKCHPRKGSLNPSRCQTLTRFIIG
jgi:hypothetical protein